MATLATVTPIADILGTQTILRTDGYDGTHGSNRIHERWQFIASVDIGGTEYQAIAYWNSQVKEWGTGRVVVGTRQIGQVWSWFVFDGYHGSGLEDLGLHEDDRHNMVSIGLDKLGYLHIVYSRGYNNLGYRRSTTPINDWSGALTEALSMLGTNENVVVYPTFFNDPSGELYFIFRDGVAGQADSHIYTYDTTTTTWSSLAGLTEGEWYRGFDTDPQSSAYHGVPAFDPDYGNGGRMYMVFRRHNPAGNGWNIGIICYDGTNWSRVNGTAFTMPVTVDNYPVEIATDQLAELDFFREIELDSNGYPHVTFTLIAANSQVQLHYAYYNGTSWTEMALTNHVSGGSMNTPGFLLDKVSDTSYVFNSYEVTGDQLTMYRSGAGDWANWDRFAASGPQGYTNPGYDDYQWATHRRMHFAVAEWYTQGMAEAKPDYEIRLLEWEDPAKVAEPEPDPDPDPTPEPDPDPGDPLQDAVRIEGSYVTVRNLRVTGSIKAGIYFNQPYGIVRDCEIYNVGIGVEVRTSDIEVYNCYIHDLNMVVNTVGGDDDYGANGVGIHGSNVEVHYCTFLRCRAESYDYGHDGGSIETYSTGIIDNIHVHHNWMELGDGVWELGGRSTGITSNVNFHHNICVNNFGRLFTVHNITGGGQYVTEIDNVIVQNNTFVDVDQGGEGIADNCLWFAGTTSLTEFIFRNNIRWKNWGYAINEDRDQFLHTHNIWFGGMNFWFITLDSTEMVVDPLFIDRLARNFRLQSTSPARNAGYFTGYPIDYDGTPLPQESIYDIGAFEFDTGQEPSPASELLDVFTTNEAAPVTSPRTCEPGPGELTFVQVDGQFYIADSKLHIPTQAGTNLSESGFYTNSSFARLNGRAFYAKFKVDAWEQFAFGWHSVGAVPAVPSTLVHGLQLSSSGGYALNTEGAIVRRSLPSFTDMQLLIVLADSRSKYIVHDGNNWVLLWVSGATTTPLFPTVVSGKLEGVIDELKVFTHGAPYDSDLGITDDWVNTPDLGHSFTHSPDCLMEFYVDALPAVGSAIRVAFRMQDSNNLWYIYIDELGNTYIFERVAGANTNRGGTLTAGVGGRVVVIADGARISLYVNGELSTSYVSTGNFQTATSGMYGNLGGTDGGTALYIMFWPRYLTGTNAPIVG